MTPEWTDVDLPGVTPSRQKRSRETTAALLKAGADMLKGRSLDELSIEDLCAEVDATVAIASTGVAGPQPQDGIAPGTVCFAWAFAGEPLAVFTRSQRFFGERADVIRQGALYGLSHLAHYHQRWLRGERA